MARREFPYRQFRDRDLRREPEKARVVLQKAYGSNNAGEFVSVDEAELKKLLAAGIVVIPKPEPEVEEEEDSNAVE